MTTYELPIVGNFYRDDMERQFFSDLMQCPELATIYFQTEPTNKHDPGAIKVMAITDPTEVTDPEIHYHIGYIAKDKTHILHKAFKYGWIVEKELKRGTNMLIVTIRDEDELTVHMPEYDPRPDK